MRYRSLLQRAGTLAAILGTAVLGATCYATNPVIPAPGDTLAVGTWGGENAGLIVGDSIAHVHIGCTLGNFAAPVTFGGAGRFNVAGIYVLRAYPVHIGPDLPALFAGQVEGTRLTLTVTVNDTVEKKTVTLGPVTVSLGRDPRMGPCPICVTPAQPIVNNIYHRGHKGHRGHGGEHFLQRTSSDVNHEHNNF